MTATLNAAGRVGARSRHATRSADAGHRSGRHAAGALGLRSTWFDVGVLSLARRRGAGRLRLDRRPHGSRPRRRRRRRSSSGRGRRWQPVGAVAPDGGRRVAAHGDTRRSTTDYRLATAQAAGRRCTCASGRAGRDARAPCRRRTVVRARSAAAGGRARAGPAAGRRRPWTTVATATVDGRTKLLRRSVRRSGGHAYRAGSHPARASRSGVTRAAERRREARAARRRSPSRALAAPAPAAAFTPTDPLAPAAVVPRRRTTPSTPGRRRRRRSRR